MKSLVDQIADLDRDRAVVEERLRSRDEEIRNSEFGTPDKAEVARLRRDHDQDRALAERLAVRSEQAAARLAAARKMLNDFERMVFSLSTGALALTVTFSGSLIGDDPTHLIQLRIAWVCFTLSIVAFPLNILIRVGQDIGMSLPFELRILGKLGFGFGFTCFILGVVSFLWFALGNLPAG